MSFAITASHQEMHNQANRKLGKTMDKDFFTCRQPKDLRAPECSGKGYAHGIKQGICSPCMRLQKERERGA